MIRPGGVFANIAFLFVRFLIHTVNNIIGLLFGRQPQPVGTVEVLQILARHKIDFSDDEDYIFWHESFEPSSILMHPNWFVAKVTSQYAYFALLPTTIENLQVDTAPFLWITFFQQACKFARMSLEDFCQLGFVVGPPKGRIAFIHNVPRCGSTLLCKMFRVPSENVIVLSEIEAFCMLTFRKWNGKRNWEEKFADDQLLPAVINIICKNMTKEQIYVIKNQPHSVRQIENLRRLYSKSNIRHIFMFRRDIEANMRSIVRVILTTEGSWDLRLVRRILDWMPSLSEHLCMVGWNRSEMRFIQQIDPKTVKDTAAIVVGSVFAQYELSKVHNDVVIFYEDLLKQPKQCMTALFKYCGIALELVDHAIEAMNSGDSQEGTFLCSAELNKIPIAPFTESDMARFYQIWNQMGTNVADVLKQPSNLLVASTP